MCVFCFCNLGQVTEWLPIGKQLTSCLLSILADCRFGFSNPGDFFLTVSFPYHYLLIPLTVLFTFTGRAAGLTLQIVSMP